MKHAFLETSFSSQDLEWLRAVQNGPEKTYSEEKRYTPRCSCFGQRAASRLETEQNRNEHHGEAAAQTAPHHRLAASSAVESESWEEGAEEDCLGLVFVSCYIRRWWFHLLTHQIDHASQQQGEISRQPNVLLQNRGNVIHN